MLNNEAAILVELQEFMGNDVSIANAAWTSTYDKSRREDKYSDESKVASLVRKLALDGHGTPFESVVLRFWIRMPIFIDRQFMTTRIASHNGLSGRYRTMPLDFFSPPKDVIDILVKANMVSAASEYNKICQEAYANYQKQIEGLKSAQEDGLIDNTEFKRVREVIRGQLPVAGMVERTTVLNLRSFANFYRQRSSAHAQKEIQTVAALMLEQIEKAAIAPTAIATLKEIGWRL